MTGVDSYVATAKFDGSQFESGVSKTMSLLDKLKASLNFGKSQAGLDQLSASANRFSMGNMATAVEGVSAKFLALGTIAITALSNITNRAVDAGLRLASSFSIAPISQGFDDYEKKLTSVQTVMNATGAGLQEVSGYFDQLDEYADKTIFKLDDMTGAFAKFTNAGVDMKTAIPAIKGISNMTAIAGQGANAASIGYYNLSQAIGAGFLSRMDFKSLELANIATKEWKDQMIQGAVAAGTLTKKGNEYVTSSGKSYSAAMLFTEGLQDQWATSKVLTDVLGKYGDETTAIGKKAQAAAQDVKSLPMMLETLRAAVGTGWTDTFEILLGTLPEAKKLFTGLTNEIGGILTSWSDARNKLLQEWKDLGGRDDLFAGIAAGWEHFLDILKPIRDAFRDIFPRTTATQLADLTSRFRSFMEGLSLGSETAENLRRTFRGVFALFSIGWSIVKGLFGVLADLFGSFDGGNGSLLDFTGTIGDFLVSLDNAIKKGGLLTGFFEGLSTILQAPIKLLGEMGSAIAGVFGDFDWDLIFAGAGVGAAAGITLLIKKIKDAITSGSIFQGIIGTITGPFGELTNTLENMQTTLQSKTLLNIAIAVGVLTASVVALSMIDAGKLSKALTAMAVGFTQLLASMAILVKISGSAGFITVPLIAGSMVLLAGALLVLTGAIAAMSALSWGQIAKGLAGVAGALVIIAGAMKLMPKSLPLTVIGLVAVSVALNLIASALTIMAQLSWEEVARGLVALAGSLIILAVGVGAMGNPASLAGAVAMLIVAPALLALAGALTAMGSLSWEEIAKGMVALAGGLTVLAIAVGVMGNPAGLAGAAVMLILAPALLALSTAVVALGNLSWEEIAKGLLALAGAFTVIGLAGLILTPLIPSLLGLGIALGLMGAGLALAGVGLISISAAFTAFVAAGAAGIAIVGGLIALIPQFLTSLANGIIQFAVVIGKGAAQMVGALSKLVMAMLNAVIKLAPKMGRAFMALLNTALRVIVQGSPKIFQAGIQLILGFLRAVSSNIGKIMPIAVSIIVKFINGIANGLPRIIEAGVNMIIKFINGTANAIDNHSAELGAAGGRLGIAMVKGMIKGIAGMAGELIGAAKNLASDAINAAKNALDIFSPSRRFEKEVGEQSVLGWARGMTKNKSKVEGASGQLADGAVSAAKNAIKALQAFVSSNMSSEPVIRPVVDMSDVENKVPKINATFAKARPKFKANTSREKAFRLASDVETFKAGRQEAFKASAEPQFKFEQNNYSPKALSTVDIYRQTRNQWSLAREALNV